jgi:hypothetical protein
LPQLAKHHDVDHRRVTIDLGHHSIVTTKRPYRQPAGRARTEERRLAVNGVLGRLQRLHGARSGIFKTTGNGDESLNAKCTTQ